MLSSIGDYLVRKYQDVPSDTAVDAFLHLMVRVVQHQSLMVSIPAVVTWGKLLNKTEHQHSDRFSPMIGPLLETAISRLVRYEYLPEDSNDPSLLFLFEDTDTMPERHAFLGNYRRYSCQVIEAIVQLKLFDAVSHILSTTDHVLQSLYQGEQPFDSKLRCALIGLSSGLIVNRGAIRETQQTFPQGRLLLHSHRSHAQRLFEVETSQS